MISVWMYTQESEQVAGRRRSVLIVLGQLYVVYCVFACMFDFGMMFSCPCFVIYLNSVQGAQHCIYNLLVSHLFRNTRDESDVVQRFPDTFHEQIASQFFRSFVATFGGRHIVTFLSLEMLHAQFW